MIVYITDDPSVGWNYDHMPDRLRPGVAEFQALTALARFCLNKRLQAAAVEFLAPALYAALLTPEPEDPRAAFKDARSYIERKTTERARIHYVMFGGLFAALFLTLAYYGQLWWGSDIRGAVAIGMGAGAVGATISVIQRVWRLRIDPLESTFYVAAQGLVRIVLGAIFGAVLIILSKGNVAFGTLSDNMLALCALAVAAGLSERIVPDLLERSATSGRFEAASIPDASAAPKPPLQPTDNQAASGRG